MDLAERFMAANGGPIEIDGRLVQNIYRREVENRIEVAIRRLAASSGPVPGLRIKVRRGMLRVNRELLSDVVLWSDTSPHEVFIQCLVPKGKGEFRAWNCWRDEQGLMQAWLCNAGMVVEEHAGVATLRCSSGPGGVSFDDLVVELRFAERAGLGD